MLFSIVIPTFNRNDLLVLCLERLSPSVQEEMEDFEVLVSDDGTTGNANELVVTRFPWVKWIPGPRKGPAANRNNGAKHARGKWLIFLDDDCLPESTLLQSYAWAAEQYKETRVFEGRIYTDRPKARHDEESPVNETGGYLWSCNFCIEKRVFDQLGGFDESFPFAAMEDVDLDYRLRKSGYEIRFVKEAGVVHPWRIGKGLSAEKRRLESTFHFLRKHPEEAKRLNSMFYVRSIYHTLRNFLVHFPQYRFKGAGYVATRVYINFLGLAKRSFLNG